MSEKVVLENATSYPMAIDKKKKLSRILLFIEIVLYISIACGMAYAIIN
jgi:hypothetical protein